jgi:hypothetical protein
MFLLFAAKVVMSASVERERRGMGAKTALRGYRMQ